MPLRREGEGGSLEICPPTLAALAGEEQRAAATGVVVSAGD